MIDRLAGKAEFKNKLLHQLILTTTAALIAKLFTHIAFGFHSEVVSKLVGQSIGPSLGLRMDAHPMVPRVSESVTP